MGSFERAEIKNSISKMQSYLKLEARKNPVRYIPNINDHSNKDLKNVKN